MGSQHIYLRRATTAHRTVRTSLAEVTKREYTPYKDYKEWVWKSQGDVMMNGAFFNESGGQNERKYDKFDFIPAKHGRYVGQLTRFAGPLKCIAGQPC